MQPAGRPAVRIQLTADQGEADEFTVGDQGTRGACTLAPPGGRAFKEVKAGIIMGTMGDMYSI